MNAGRWEDKVLSHSAVCLACACVAHATYAMGSHSELYPFAMVFRSTVADGSEEGWDGMGYFDRVGGWICPDGRTGCCFDARSHSQVRRILP